MRVNVTSPSAVNCSLSGSRPRSVHCSANICSRYTRPHQHCMARGYCALDAACMRGGEAPPLFPLAEELTRKINERDDPHDLWRLLHEDDDLGGTGVA